MFIRCLLALFFSLILTVTSSAAADFEGTIWANAGVEPELLYAVALVETRTVSAQDRSLAVPRPFIFRVGDDIFEFATYPEAVDALTQVLHTAPSRRKIDIGIMQINAHWHRSRVEELTDLLVPSIAIRIAAEILQETMASTDDILLGVGRYHSYTPARAKRYGKDVVHIACGIGWDANICTASSIALR